MRCLVDCRSIFGCVNLGYGAGNSGLETGNETTELPFRGTVKTNYPTRIYLQGNQVELLDLISIW